MWRQLGAIGTLVATAALWPACSGEEFFDAGGRIECSTTAQCDNDKTGLMCIDAQCRYPDGGHDFCCDKASEATGECNRKCRRVAECAGANIACHDNSECSGLSHADPRCESVACVDGFCRRQLLEVAATQREGDCTLVLCNEKGETYDEAAPDDVFNDGNQCTEDACVEMKAVNTPRGKGKAPESSGFCDGSGHWVGCLTDEDCGNTSYACSTAGVCVLQWCADGNLDENLGETAIDCGGPCAPCAAGKPCRRGDDCADHYCEPTGLCAQPRCDDYKQNGTETGVDCGSPSCEPCADRARCNTHEDCASGVCKLGVCAAATCTDGVMNNQESGVDCGGGCPLRCPEPIRWDGSQQREAR
jgi:hypothetical protein